MQALADGRLFRISKSCTRHVYWAAWALLLIGVLAFAGLFVRPTAKRTMDILVFCGAGTIFSVFAAMGFRFVWRADEYGIELNDSGIVSLSSRYRGSRIPWNARVRFKERAILHRLELHSIGKRNHLDLSYYLEEFDQLLGIVASKFPPSVPVGSVDTFREQIAQSEAIPMMLFGVSFSVIALLALLGGRPGVAFLFLGIVGLILLCGLHHPGSPRWVTVNSRGCTLMKGFRRRRVDFENLCAVELGLEPLWDTQSMVDVRLKSHDGEIIRARPPGADVFALYQLLSRTWEESRNQDDEKDNRTA